MDLNWQDLVKSNHIISKRWLSLAVIALAVAGILSIILVLVRIPFINRLLLPVISFKTILIVHVNLSILVWLLSVTASIWCLYIHKSLFFVVNLLNYIAWLGVILITIAGFVTDSTAVSNNYIPILHNLPFIVGLACFLSSILCLSIIIFMSYIFNHLAITDNLMILISSSFIFLAVTLCLYMSYLGLAMHDKYMLDLYFYYEMLFWGGGHILQFLYSHMISYVWLILASRVYRFNTLDNLYAICFVLNSLLVVPALILYWLVHIDDILYTEFFTLHMRYFGGVTPISVLCLLIWQIYSSRETNYLSDYCRTALIASVIMFIAGGLMGLCIAGTNVTIPAHYHGSIVGITIGFMGYSYHYIALNYTTSQLSNDLMSKRQASLQIIVYAIGQFIHIAGLFIAGGYGAMRKMPGEELAVKAKIGMTIMGIGGLIAIVGGLTFIIICAKNCNILKYNQPIK